MARFSKTHSTAPRSDRGRWEWGDMCLRCGIGCPLAEGFVSNAGMPVGRTGLFVLIFAVLIILLGLGAVSVFNRLVRARNQLREGWSGIDVQLKRRHDLVPSLVECVSAYQSHERDLLEAVVRERAEAGAATDAASASGPETLLGRDLGRLIAVAEDFPELKASARFLDLMRELVAVEDQLQYARRYYNGSARDLNNVVESFPSNLVAGPAGFKTAAFFEVEQASDRLAPDLARQLREPVVIADRP